MTAVYCFNCSGGNHGNCTLDYCACPMPQCSQARQNGSWKNFSAGLDKLKTLGEQDGRLIFRRARK